MENIIIIVLLVIITAEASYLVAVNSKKRIYKKNGKPIFVDTSVLIDGRILSIAKSGFITDTLYIPRSVIGELQYLADNADSEKRTRARHGLDVVSELQAMPSLKVEIFQDGSKAEEGVDERLLKLAKQYKGVVCTIDFNLNKVAQVENIPVLNVNDLAMSLRMAYLPGEKILLEMTQKGNDSHQAVGHLTDGTMVVVEHASQLIGQTVEIEFIRSLQTSAGKMMFAKLVEAKNAPQPKVQKQPRVIAQVAATPKVSSYKQPRNESPESQPKPVSKKNTDGAPKNKKPSHAKPQDAQPDKPYRSKKPKTSSQNEDDLIKLLNNQ